MLTSSNIILTRHEYSSNIILTRHEYSIFLNHLFRICGLKPLNLPSDIMWYIRPFGSLYKCTVDPWHPAQSAFWTEWNIVFQCFSPVLHQNICIIKCPEQSCRKTLNATTGAETTPPRLTQPRFPPRKCQRRNIPTWHHLGSWRSKWTLKERGSNISHKIRYANLNKK